MNSIWNKNLSLLEERFSGLLDLFGITDIDRNDIPSEFRADMEIFPSKSGTLTARENGKPLHSNYNPQREADSTAEGAKKSAETINSVCFFSIGLGYAAISYAKKFAEDSIIVVEPDLKHFLTALSVTDFSELFRAKNLMLAIQTGVDIVINLIEKSGGFKKMAIVENQNQSEHGRAYFAALRESMARAKSKDKINNFTLEKFSTLWTRNSCRNIKKLAELDGVIRYENKCDENLPFVILAAGPTLDEALPHLGEIKKRAVLVAVDTALRACLRNGVEPDFVVLSDPQFYAYQHIQGLKSPSSILITETAAYPAVFRFVCKETILMSPFFQIGKFFENHVGKKGELSSGGSVSTTAWDFARLSGAKKIYFAGLDLGFPDFQTHIRGSTFEEKIHTISDRLNPAEKFGVASLFGANMEFSLDYSGRKILTDNRMKMFSWWFENKALEHEEIESFSFSERSLKIPGFKTARLDAFLSEKEKIPERNKFFSNFGKINRSETEKKFVSAYNSLTEGLEKLYECAKKGIATAENAMKDRLGQKNYLSQLEKIDSEIMASECKDIASLVFPTENQLDKIFSEFQFSSDKTISSFQHSKIIYRELQAGIVKYRKFLTKI